MRCTTLIGQATGFGVSETTFTRPGYAELAATVGVWTGDAGICCHPVVFICGALFCRQ